MKMNREQLEQDILAYVEGQLPPAEAAKLEVYLDNTDPKLKEMVVGMLADRAVLRSLPPLRAPKDLAERTMEQIERASLLSGTERQLAIRPKRWWHSRLAAAAAILVVLGGFSYVIVTTMWSNSPDDEWHRWAAKRPMENEPQVADAGKEAAPKATDGFEGTAGGINETEKRLRENKDGVGELQVAKGTAGAGAGAPAAKYGWLGHGVGGTTDALDQPRQVALGSAVARKAAIAEAASAEAALANLRATPDQYQAGPAVVVTLRTRDGQDTRRLREMLASMARADGEMAQRQDVLDERRTGDALTDNKLGERGTRRPTNQKQPNTEPKAEEQPPMAQAAEVASRRTGMEMQRLVVRPHVAMKEDGTIGKAGPAMKPGLSKSAGEKARADEAVAIVGQDGTPYHVVMRAEQLEALSREFAVASVARGDAMYAVADGQDRSEKSKNVLADRDVTQVPPRSVMTAAPAPTATPMGAATSVAGIAKGSGQPTPNGAASLSETTADATGGTSNITGATANTSPRVMNNTGGSNFDNSNGYMNQAAGPVMVNNGTQAVQSTATQTALATRDLGQQAGRGQRNAPAGPTAPAEPLDRVTNGDVGSMHYAARPKTAATPTPTMPQKRQAEEQWVEVIIDFVGADGR